MALFRATSAALRRTAVFQPLAPLQSAYHQPGRAASTGEAKPDDSDVFKPPKMYINGKQVPNTPSEICIWHLEEMKREIEKGSGTEKLRPLLEYAHRLIARQYSYAVKMSSPVSEDIKRLYKKIAAVDFHDVYEKGQMGEEYFQEGGTDDLQGTFLKFLINLTGAKRVCEIGTFMGYSSAFMVEGLPSDGTLTTVDIGEYNSQFARDYFDTTAHKGKVECVTADGGEYLIQAGKEGKQFDFVFLDGCRTYTQYTEFTKIMLDNDVLPINGILAADNCFSKGGPYMLDDYPVPEFDIYSQDMHDFNTYIKNEDRLEQVLVPIRDGLNLAKRVR